MSKAFVLDLGERALGAFLGAAVGVLGLDVTNVLNLAVWQQAATAGASAAAVLVLGLLSKPVGDKQTASVQKKQ